MDNHRLCSHVRRDLKRLDLCLVTGRFPQVSEQFVYRKAAALARRQHRVLVLARAPGDLEHFSAPLPDTLKVELLPPDMSLSDPMRVLQAASRIFRALPRSCAFMLELYRRCAEDPRTARDAKRNFVRHLPLVNRRTDVIHFEFLGTAAMYQLASEITDAPVVVSCRGSDIHLFDLRPPLIREAMLASLRAASAVHCVSNELANQVSALIGGRQKIRINRPAVDTSAILPRPHASRQSGRFHLVSTGRLSWHKGFDYLLAAFALLKKQGLRFSAAILGDGELMAPLRFSVMDLGLEGMVELRGAASSPEVLAELQRADLFVLPSHNEGISNAVLEAMASGVPVVSTRVGGMPEAIDHGVEGLLVPPRDVEALAFAIEQIACDRTRAIEMGRAARLRAEREFSLDRQTTVFEAMYRELAGVA